jgi:two-component system cell cycle response regulator DivK
MTPEPPLVLIVDDNERNRKLVRNVLQLAGFGTIEAASGRAGIDLAVEQLPDVILMDLRLPDMDGTAAARSLRDDPRTAPLPIVALTSLALDDEDGWLQRSGFDGYLEKPIDVREFPGQVRRYCGRGRRPRGGASIRARRVQPW